MPPAPKRADAPENTIPCDVCEKEVPLSEALTSEAEDYVMYFCGVDCLEHWRKKAEQQYGETLPDFKHSREK